jgi:sarcosine oxidase
MGSMALWQCASRGAKVLGLERFTIGHDRGAGHGDSKIFRTAYAEGAEYVPLLKAALELWHLLEEETGKPLLMMTGGVMIGDPADGFLRGVVASARLHGLLHHVLTPDQAMQRFPQLRLAAREHAVWEPRAGVLRPELAIAAAVDRARQLGAETLEQVTVQRLSDCGSHVRLETERRTFQVARAVVTVGAWTPTLVPLPGMDRCWVERQVQAWFRLEELDLYRPERFGIFARYLDGINWYGFPTLDGSTIKVAFHHGGARADPDGIDRVVHATDLDPLRERVRLGLRGVSQEVVRATTCLYINTPDDHFVIGPATSSGRIVVAGPMAGHGFKFAPVVGGIVADLVLEGRTGYPIEPFDPGRPSFAGER